MYISKINSIRSNLDKYFDDISQINMRHFVRNFNLVRINGIKLGENNNISQGQILRINIILSVRSSPQGRRLFH